MGDYLKPMYIVRINAVSECGAKCELSITLIMSGASDTGHGAACSHPTLTTQHFPPIPRHADI